MNDIFIDINVITIIVLGDVYRDRNIMMEVCAS